MGRRKREPMSAGKRNIIAGLLQEYDIRTAKDIEDALKDLLGGTIQEMLEAEMDEHLGYSSYERSDNTDYRNGKKAKKIRGNFGETEMEVPQDRDGSFEPKVVQKRQKDISGIEQKIISLYKIYPIVFFDGIVFNSRKDNKIISKCVYSVLGINIEGQKEILGTWISENESASFYASICSDLKNRGVTDIFIAIFHSEDDVTDNLTGLCDAINAIFPRTKNQLCIVHQIRNSCKFVPYKDRKAVCADLKKIYGAVNLDDAEYAKEEFRENMGMDLQTNPKVSQHLKILG